MTDAEVRSLLLFAGLAGGVLMTSDKLDEIPERRADTFAELLAMRSVRCEFPELGPEAESLIVQRASLPEGTVLLNVLNTADRPQQFEIDEQDLKGMILIEPHASQLLRMSPSQAKTRC